MLMVILIVTMTHSCFIRYVTLINGGNESLVQDENSVSFQS